MTDPKVKLYCDLCKAPFQRHHKVNELGEGVYHTSCYKKVCHSQDSKCEHIPVPCYTPTCDGVEFQHSFHCENCGEALKPTEKYPKCEHVWTWTEDKIEYCSKCDEPRTPTEKDPEPKFQQRKTIEICPFCEEVFIADSEKYYWHLKIHQSKSPEKDPVEKCDYGEHQWNQVEDGKRCIKCKLEIPTEKDPAEKLQKCGHPEDYWSVVHQCCAVCRDNQSENVQSWQEELKRVVASSGYDGIKTYVSTLLSQAREETEKRIPTLGEIFELKQEARTQVLANVRTEIKNLNRIHNCPVSDMSKNCECFETAIRDMLESLDLELLNQLK